ncbi:unnamed protein product [Oikopleura dioica]|uniref:Uncharacterized protein n=1 Tax=Oikopleura dioica TaxID=34765 RepID=E4YB94_OIKDI|nr:unnamed protein product [Oikopleura dioica]
MSSNSNREREVRKQLIPYESASIRIERRWDFEKERRFSKRRIRTNSEHSNIPIIICNKSESRMDASDLESLSSVSICAEENVLLEYEEKQKSLEDRLFEEQAKNSALLSENNSIKQISKQMLDEKINAENNLDTLELEIERVKFKLAEKEDEIEALKENLSKIDEKEKIQQLEEELVKVYEKLVEISDERGFFKNLFESLTTAKSTENSSRALNEKELKLVTVKFEEQQKINNNLQEKLDHVSSESKKRDDENRNLRKLSFESKMLLNQLGRENAELKNELRKNQQAHIDLNLSIQSVENLERTLEIKEENIQKLNQRNKFLNKNLNISREQTETLQAEINEHCGNFEMAKDDLLICRRNLKNREETIIMQNSKIDALENIVRKIPKSKIYYMSSTQTNCFADVKKIQIATQTSFADDEDETESTILPVEVEEICFHENENNEDKEFEKEVFEDKNNSETQIESEPKITSIEESIQMYFDEFCLQNEQPCFNPSRSSSRFSESTVCSFYQNIDEKRCRRKIRQLEIAFNKAMSSKRRKSEKLQALEQRIYSITQQNEKT